MQEAQLRIQRHRTEPVNRAIIFQQDQAITIPSANAKAAIVGNDIVEPEMLHDCICGNLVPAMLGQKAVRAMSAASTVARPSSWGLWRARYSPSASVTACAAARCCSALRALTASTFALC
jgi:hypothetical protein